MTRKQKKNLIRIIISLVLFIVIFIIDKVIVLSSVFDNYSFLLPLVLYLLVYLIIGYDVLKKAFLNIIRGHMLDENFLMAIASLGAFVLAVYKGIKKENIEGFDEACAVLLFYQVGEWFQSYAVRKSRNSISELMDIRPDYANKVVDNEVISVSPDEVLINDIIVVYPGEKVPLDGVIVKGNTNLDMKALNGESLPRYVSNTDEVLSGSINIDSTIEIRVTKLFYDSTVCKILDLVENASNYKSKTENFITKFAKFYTPIVVTLALLLFLIPSIITNNWSLWTYRALSFLVVSCPCALVISVPLSFFAGLGCASKNGILIKGSNYLELLNNANIFVFDKTGTLTKGNFKVNEIYSVSGDKSNVLKYAAYAEYSSSHPIARAIVAEYDDIIDTNYTITNKAGYGIYARGKHLILCGNEKLMNLENIKYINPKTSGSICHVALDNEYLGYIVISDEIKEESYNVISSLNNNKFKTIMLTGDNDVIAKNVFDSLNLSSYKSELLPQDKVNEVNMLLSNKSNKDVLLYIGDGINDAPVLMMSDIGVSMGGVGSDSAIEASDIVLMNDDLNGILKSKLIAKKTMRIVYENIIFALGIKIIILILSSLGITNMWFAVFGDVGVCVLAILNALRISFNRI